MRNYFWLEPRVAHTFSSSCSPIVRGDLEAVPAARGRALGKLPAYLRNDNSSDGLIFDSPHDK